MLLLLLFVFSLNQGDSSCSYHVSSILKTDSNNPLLLIDNELEKSYRYLIVPLYNPSNQHWAMLLFAVYFPSKIIVLQSKPDVATSNYVNSFASKMNRDLIQRPLDNNCHPGYYVISLLRTVTFNIYNPLKKDILEEKLQKNLFFLHDLNDLLDGCDATKKSLCSFCTVIFKEIVHQHSITYRGIMNSGTSCYIIAMFQMMFTSIDWFIEIATKINNSVAKKVTVCGFKFVT